MRRHLLRSVLALSLLPALASAQEPVIRRVLEGEPASIIFGPHGGYAAQNYLKKQRNTGGPMPGDQWATQNGALAELIRRCTPGGKVIIASFRLDEKEVLDSCFEVARTKNVTVKLWLKGPPGLTYMVDGHEAIAARANEYLRQRTQQNKQAEWGDFQVMIGTAEQMSAFGKFNDMHEKFGVIDVTPEHAAGRNHAFLGTSNIGSSSDRSHNESRLFFLGNPQATQRLWQELARLWTHLGKCETFKDGAVGGTPNATPETVEAARIRVGDGFADEGPDDVLQFRFTYEKDPDGRFHRITDDFVRGIKEAASLPAGSVVWIGQFGFQISSITDALLLTARATPHVEFRVMAHMAETDAGDVSRLVRAKLPNLKCGLKWDSNKLMLEPGARPRAPGPTDPGPALMHHKTLLVGDRTMITGSFNFFGDADDQGENIVIIRNHLAPTYAAVLADTRAEFEAMWASPVIIDAARVHGPDGLLATIEALSEEDGFLETLAAVGAEPASIDELKAALGATAPADADLKRYLDALERFEFVEKDAAGELYKAEPDVVAHAAKPGVRATAVEGPPPTEDIVRGVVVLEGTAVRLRGATTTTTVSAPTELTATLRLLRGREAAVFGTIASVGTGTASVAATRLVSPTRGETTGIVERQDGKTYLRVGATRLEAFGPSAWLLVGALGKRVVVDGYALTDALCVLRVQADVIKTGLLTKSFNVPLGTVQKGQKVWASRTNANGAQTEIEHASREGWFPSDRLAIGATIAGLVDSIPTPGQ